MNGHSAFFEGPVGVPNWSSAFEFCTLGPGAPTTLMISGAKIAANTKSTITPSEIIATVSARNRRQKSSSGDRAGMSTTMPCASASAADSASSSRSGAPTLMG